MTSRVPNSSLRRLLRMRRYDRLSRLLTADELAYLSRAVYRQRMDRPDDEPGLASQLDPLISVARNQASAKAGLVPVRVRTRWWAR